MNAAPPHGPYAERLHVPLRWWALATMFLATVLLAFLVATPAWLAFAVTGLFAAATVALFLGYGGARVRVVEGEHGAELHAGRARIPVDLLGVPVALDAMASRRLAGVDADARAYLLLRPYVSGSVQVPVDDPHDPAPYWLLSTRRPRRLVEALVAAGAPSGAPSSDPAGDPADDQE
jgi:Protein of unknown function (DUF3093)